MTDEVLYILGSVLDGSTVEELSFIGCHHITDVGISFLRNLSKLKTVSARNVFYFNIEVDKNVEAGSCIRLSKYFWFVFPKSTGMLSWGCKNSLTVFKDTYLKVWSQCNLVFVFYYCLTMEILQKLGIYSICRLKDEVYSIIMSTRKGGSILYLSASKKGAYPGEPTRTPFQWECPLTQNLPYLVSSYF